MSPAPEFSGLCTCGHCRNTAPMQIVARHSEVEDFDEQGTRWTAGPIFELLKCPACSGITLRTFHYHDAMEDEAEVVYKILYPSDRPKPRGLPQSIAPDYEAAQQVRNISPNAFGVLLGRVLELVCEDRKASGDSLHKKLKDLANKGEIPAKLVEVAQSLKDLRNVGAHASLGNLTAEEVPILDDLTRAILEYVYSAPALADAAVQRLHALRNRGTK